MLSEEYEECRKLGEMLFQTAVSAVQRIPKQEALDTTGPDPEKGQNLSSVNVEELGKAKGFSVSQAQARITPGTDNAHDNWNLSSAALTDLTPPAKHIP